MLLIEIYVLCVVDKHVKEQRLWTEEIVQLKKVKDRLEMETVRKDTQLLEAKTEIDKSAVALSNAEVRINSLKKQVFFIFIIIYFFFFFYDALNTFYLRLYGVRHMVKDHSDSEKGSFFLFFL